MGAFSKLLSLAGMMVPVGILALSACTATIEPGPTRPAACAMERAPVCGQRGSQSRTFQNSCLARADGSGWSIRESACAWLRVLRRWPAR